MQLRTSLHCGNGMAPPNSPQRPAANRDLMVDTMIPTRSRPRGAGRPKTRPTAAVADALHAHPRVDAPRADGIRAGLANVVATVTALARDLSTPMLSLVIANVVAFCTRYVWSVILVAAVAAGGSGYYAARHFVI